MKQIVQDLSSGETILAELPAPAIRSGQVLIKSHRSLVSLGTEKTLVDFGRAGWISKVRSQPEKVKQVLEKVKSDGLKPTLDAVFRKLGKPLPLGYCNAGEVIGVGRGVSGFQVGDRVVSNGNHAEVVSVPENLVAKIPDGVSYEDAAFTVIGAIALQGIRLINPTFGETIVVTGMGLIGLVGCQLLKANGCRVIGLDFDQNKLDRAAAWGIETINVGKDDAVNAVTQLTEGIGADGVLITASAKTNDVISQAAQMSRQKGRIVLVGVVENRNFQAVLHAIASGQLSVNSLITERVALEDFNQIYGDMGKGGSIASILTYPVPASAPKRSVDVTERKFTAGSGTMGIIGAGNFTEAMILPCLKKVGAPLKYISSAGGLSGTTVAQKFGIGQSVTDNNIMLDDPDLDAILITTRHNAHADQVIEALEAGKHVFVEKPLALTHEELDRVQAAYEKADKSVVMNALGPNAAENTDNASILLRYENGSQGVINYFANGSKAYSKERIEVYSQNRTAVIDNFRRSYYHGFSGSGMKKGQDKGHAEQFRRFYVSLKSGGPAIVPIQEVMNASRAAICAVDSLKAGRWVEV